KGCTPAHNSPRSCPDPLVAEVLSHTFCPRRGRVTTRTGNSAVGSRQLLADQLLQQGPQPRGFFECLAQLGDVVGAGKHRVTPECAVRRVRAEANHDEALVALALELEELEGGFRVLASRRRLFDNLAAAPWVLERSRDFSRHDAKLGAASARSLGARRERSG